MSDTPWLTIIGLGEDGPESLPAASRKALEAAEVVTGPPRHLSLLPDIAAERIEWPVPFSDGIERLLTLRGRQVVMLASGDPFWFGAGTSVTAHLQPGEWVAHPGVSTFSLAAAQMGWPLECTGCFGLHAAPLARLRLALQEGARLIVLLRDGAALRTLADYLVTTGWGASDLTVLESLGGPRARRTDATAQTLPVGDYRHPLCAALQIRGARAQALPLVAGRPDAWFDSDGTMTKRPVRAMTLSALAPRRGEHLWDIGGGSGSIAIEWLLSDASVTATTIEPRGDRVARIRANAIALGVDRLQIVEGAAPEALDGLAPPDAVFIGGGLSPALLDRLESTLAPGTRLVANAVTLDSESLLISAQERRGGDLLRLELATALPLGSKRGWKSAYPIVQWSVTL